MGIDKPDWDRYVQTPPTGLKPLGDPNRWGAVDVTQLTAAAEIDRRGEQFLRVQSRDPYSRSWSVLGTVSLPVVTWNAIDGGTLLIPRLSVSMGVGQATVVQELNLRTLTNQVNLPIPTGVYLPIFAGGPGGVTYESRAWAAIGALIGSSIAIAMNYSHVVAVPGLPNAAIVTAIVTPYAPGAGL